MSLIFRGGVQGKDDCDYVVGCVVGSGRERHRGVNLIYVCGLC